MDSFRLDHRVLPPMLYRIQYDGCMTIHCCSGFAAKDTETSYTEPDDTFGAAVEDHLCWRRSRPSIFISLFATKKHAENWALQWNASHDGRSCDVFWIEPSKLAGSYVFHADKIRKYLELQVPLEVEASILDEYLVVYSVPEQAIVRGQSVEGIQRGE